MTYLSFLREEVHILNQVVLARLPTENPVVILEAEDYENDRCINPTEYSKVFKRGTNFLHVTCMVGAKVMFLTNGMLGEKGISNGSIGFIREVFQNEEVEAVFPTKDGIQVCAHLQALHPSAT